MCTSVLKVAIGLGASYDCSSKGDDRHLLGRAFAELVCYIESSVVNGTLYIQTFSVALPL